jgi:hypothetical protein
MKRIIYISILFTRKWVSKFGSNYTMLKDRGSNQSYKPITNPKNGGTQLAAASNKVYQLLAQCLWLSPASSTTKLVATI